MFKSLLPLVVLFAVTLAAAASPRTIYTVAGNGSKGFAGDNGLANSAALHGPTGICRGPDGALYVCDTDNHAIRKVTPEGIITTVAGTGRKGYTGDNGPAARAQLNEPYEVRFDKAGNLYFCERLNHVIRKVDGKTQVVSTFAGTGKPGFSGDGGPAAQATFKEPHSIQFGPDGSLYVCDIGNGRIRRIDASTGIVTTFAGTGEKKPTPDGGTIAGSPLNGPRAIDFDKDGNLWVALREGNAVYELDLKSGTVHHAAGTGKKGFTGNGGPALAATFSGPKGIAVGPDGSVYLADTESHSIRMIDRKTGNLELVAGNGAKGDGPDGDPAACKLSRPHGIFVDADGSIFVGDTEANRVRLIRASQPRALWRPAKTDEPKPQTRQPDRTQESGR